MKNRKPRPPLTVRRRAELIMAKLHDVLNRRPPRGVQEQVRRSEEILHECELHLRGAMRGLMEVAAGRFETLGVMQGSTVAQVLRDSVAKFRADTEGEALGLCGACDRPFSSHDKFFVGEDDKFEFQICLAVPTGMVIVLGPDTAREFTGYANAFRPEPSLPQPPAPSPLVL